MWILREAVICQYPAPPSEPLRGFGIVVRCYTSSVSVAILESLGHLVCSLSKGIVKSALWLLMNLRNSVCVLTVKCW